MTFDHITDAVYQERLRQIKLFGCDRNFIDLDRSYLPILVEEVGEVAKAIHEGDTGGLYEELIQVAAVCFAWLQRDRAPEEHPKCHLTQQQLNALQTISLL